MAAATSKIPRFEAEPSPEPGKQVNIWREAVYTWLALVFTLVTTAMVVGGLGPIVWQRLNKGNPWLAFEDAAFILLVVYFVFGSVLYQICRLGYLKRLASHVPASRAELETIYDSTSPPPLVILVPSYREEERVVRQTLMSAALMEYPDRRVMLLIDDPPNPSDRAEAMALVRMQRLPQEIDALLRSQERKYANELADFEHRNAGATVDPKWEARRLGNLYREVATWMEGQAARLEVGDHTDKLFVSRILLEPARAHRARAAQWSGRQAADPAPSGAELHREYRRLTALFRVRLGSFERKRFANLSHAPNKAMNLNSYIGLIGRNFREVIQPDGLHLQECDASAANLKVRDADYVITVDADSLLLNDYALRLIHVMEQPNSPYAVVQTPYTAVPGSPSYLERVAGAQTDIQWMMGQGSTLYHATFWIGASAMLRRKALEDICQTVHERGHPIKKYIRDHTLTEDTESTVDLIATGWQLYNYPDRLSYSATPRDFGTLLIQRRRWANGGLLILPKMFRYLASGRIGIRRLPEAVLRAQYLVTTTLGNLGMLMLLLVPFDQTITSSWLPLTAVPYYVLYGRDLVGNGYSWVDLAPSYALNLLLVPVNLGGVAKSIHQWWTGRPSPFTRTPKVPGRTSAPPFYIFLVLAISAGASVVTAIRFYGAAWVWGALGFLNVYMLVYAFLRFVGLRYAWEDVRADIATRNKLGSEVSSPSVVDSSV